jgi:hypothetical protein
VVELKNENIKLSQFDMNDAYYIVPIKEDIVYLHNIFKESDKESDNVKSDNYDISPHFTLLNKLAEVEPEDQYDDIWDLDLSLSTVGNVIADSTLPTGTPILESQDIWIANTRATSHVTKHAGGKKKHHQTSVRTCGFAGETIKPNCEMDIPVTYCGKEGTEKFGVVLRDMQRYEKFNFNLFGVTKIL